MGKTVTTVSPLWYQLDGWRAVSKGIRRKITSYPRRHGKDFEDLGLAFHECFRRRGSYYYVFPTRRWGERAIWETMAEVDGQSKPIIDWLFPSEVCKKFKSDLRIEINGKDGVSKFFMGGTDNLDFVGQGGQGYTMSEFSLHKESVTSLLAPIIRQSDAYLRLNGTMRGKENPLYRILQNTLDDPEWYSTWLKPIDTKLYCWVGDDVCINPDVQALIGQIDPRTGELYKNVQGVPYYNIQSDIDSGLVSYAYARQEFLNEADGGVVGAYFQYELGKMRAAGRIKGFGGIDFKKALFTAWDIGGASQTSDNTAVVFTQETKAGYRIVGFYDRGGQSIGDDIKEVRRLGTGARFGGHFAPHDAKKTSKQTQMDLMEFCRREFKFEFRRVPKTQNVLRDIEICRRSFATLEIDTDGFGMDRFLDLLGTYREDPKTGRPDHKTDDSSHGGDSFRTFIMALHHKIMKDYLVDTRDEWKQQKGDEFEGDYSGYSLEF